ncbi:hypothetical protein [Clavibacter michiganensis]|uniref:hypothetical protein n=1 Tax=Clavibacter michiganensis TaxID=28447 RepID=UPI00117CED90|nr:hypothetical protein [Clavibacter michiganensis]
MRIVTYRQGSGRPSEAARGNLNELVMLMEAAVALANVERWVQESVAVAARDKAGKSILTDAVRGAGKRDSYEVSVVDGFMRLAAVSFAAHGSEAVWERSFPTGKKGRPLAVDVCLFNAKRNEEARVEFGKYKLSKLRDDAQKLIIDLSAPEPHMVTNFVMLWRTRETSVLSSGKSWRDEVILDASKASADSYTVKMEVASEQDMFVAGSSDRRKVQVALFSVRAISPGGPHEGEAATSMADLPLLP